MSTVISCKNELRHRKKDRRRPKGEDSLTLNNQTQRVLGAFFSRRGAGTYPTPAEAATKMWHSKPPGEEAIRPHSCPLETPLAPSPPRALPLCWATGGACTLRVERAEV